MNDAVEEEREREGKVREAAGGKGETGDAVNTACGSMAPRGPLPCWEGGIERCSQEDAAGFGRGPCEKEPAM